MVLRGNVVIGCATFQFYVMEVRVSRESDPFKPTINLEGRGLGRIFFRSAIENSSDLSERGEIHS